MKKLILVILTLFSLTSYGQAEFDSGIQITGGQPTVTTAPYLTTTEANGVQGKIDPINLPLSNSSKNYIDSKIPDNFTKAVYVNNNNPNSATIFDVNNPPTVNDNLLKSDVNNLYIGLDASTWVYNSSIYVTKTIPAAPAIFNYAGTSVPAGNTTSPIVRTGSIASGTNIPTAKIHAYETSTGNNRLVYAESNLTPTVGVTMNQGIAFTQLSTEAVNPGYSIFGYNVNPQSSTAIISGIALNADTGTVPSILMQGERVANTGSLPSVLVNRPVFGISNYSTRLLTVLPSGNLGIGIDLPTQKLEVTGNSRINGSLALNSTPSATSLFNIGGDITGGVSASSFFNQSTIQPGVTSNVFYNRTQSNTAVASFNVGTIFHNFVGQGIFGAGSTVTNQNGFFVDSGMVGATNNRGFVGNIVANASNNFNAYMSGTAPNYFNGTTGIGIVPVVSATDKLQVNGNVTASTATAANHVVIKSQLDLKADIASPAFTGTPTAPTPAPGTNTTQVATTAFVTGGIATSDAGNVKLTGNQTKIGLLTFSNTGGSLSNGIVLNNNGSNSEGIINIGNNSTGVGLYGLNTSTGQLIVAAGTSGSTGLLFVGKNSTTNTFTVNKLGDVTANTLTLNSVLKLKAYTVGTLPAGTVGDMAYVTDATAPTYNGTLTGGGSVSIPVFYDGTAWKAH